MFPGSPFRTSGNHHFLVFLVLFSLLEYASRDRLRIYLFGRDGPRTLLTSSWQQHWLSGHGPIVIVLISAAQMLYGPNLCTAEMSTSKYVLACSFRGVGPTSKYVRTNDGVVIPRPRPHVHAAHGTRTPDPRAYAQRTRTLHLPKHTNTQLQLQLHSYSYSCTPSLRTHGAHELRSTHGAHTPPSISPLSNES